MDGNSPIPKMELTPIHMSDSPSTEVPNSQKPGHPSFRRQRASRACETCHSRKVRCDAASLGVPCTNCVAFSIECKIPAPKRKKTGGSKAKDSDSERGDTTQDGLLSPIMPDEPVGDDPIDSATIFNSEKAVLGLREADMYTKGQDQHKDTYVQIMKPKFVRAPIKEAGRVAYLGESSNLSLLVHDRHGTSDVVHYPLPDNVRGPRARLEEFDKVEIDILHQRGAFLLPPRGLCDELVEAFFKWVAPVVPVINRSRFMRRYRDTKNPPSLLLLQSILLAGSRVCKNPQLMDSNGSTTPAAMTFYKRAKALFDANYEDDRVTIVQAVVLMGWYWEGPEDVTKNVFYWSRVAIIVAQGSGMHRSVETSQLSRADKRLWKRIWWTLFTRDRSVAVALGRPCCINTDDSDIEMVSEDDFIDDELDKPAEYPADAIHIQFFLNYVKLCEIMGLVLSQQYSVACKIKKHNALDLTHSDMALADWLQNCPKEVYWERPRHHFWSALLHSNYYTTLCLLHRAHMPPAGVPMTTVQNGYVVESAYPSRNIAYQAAGMITSIIESLQAHDQLRFTPAFIVYSLFSALIMHVYQMRSTNTAIVQATEQRIQICMVALKDVSKVWLVAKMVHTLFESILGNKVLEERLQKAAGRRHQKSMKPNSTAKASVAASEAGDPSNPSAKRKFDETDIGGFPNGAPAPQMSYERSRPQTPAQTPSRDLGPTQHHNLIPSNVPLVTTATSPPIPSRPEATSMFPTNSRVNTRPTSPFYPGTPQELFLVTRNSPTFSQDLWNNFQPDQLFPADTQLHFSSMSPQSQTAYLDPQLAPSNINGPGGSGVAPMMTSPSNQQSQYQQMPQRHHSISHPNGMHTLQQQAQMQQHPGSHGNLTPQGQHQLHPGQHHHQHQHQHQHPRHQQPPLPHHAHQQHLGDSSDWAHIEAMNRAQHSNLQRAEDTGSNSSMSQAPVPTTLNVEDWFQFFGINGDLANPLGSF